MDQEKVVIDCTGIISCHHYQELGDRHIFSEAPSFNICRLSWMRAKFSLMSVRQLFPRLLSACQASPGIKPCNRGLRLIVVRCSTSSSIGIRLMRKLLSVDTDTARNFSACQGVFSLSNDSSGALGLSVRAFVLAMCCSSTDLQRYKPIFTNIFTIPSFDFSGTAKGAHRNQCLSYLLPGTPYSCQI